jgi:glycosyltransferase involved in cell wall biosynthesis
MKILFLTNVLPFKRRNGGEVCTSRLIARLCNLSNRVLVVGRGDATGAPKLSKLEVLSLAPAATEFAKMSLTQKLLLLVSALASGEAYTVHRMSSGVIQTLRQTVGNEDFDCVFIDHLQIYKWYQALELVKPAVLVAHNVEHQVYGDLLKRSKNIFSRWVLAREQRLLSYLDKEILRYIGIVACLTEDDRAYYEKCASAIGVNLVIESLPGYFDADIVRNSNVAAVELNSARPRRIGILGTWTWESNRLGVEWFLNEVLPHIDDDCEVVIAGRGLQIDQLPSRVRYLGFVDSAEQFFRSCDLIAIPSIAGGGVQEKTIEAIGYGVPIVATDIAMRGIQPCPLHVKILSTPKEFAAACCIDQECDAEHINAEVFSWNLNRQSRYNLAIDNLFSAISRHTDVI